jgi:predicted Na+-dependent transporter
LLGGLVAFVCKRPAKQIFTIGIETGFQNTGVAFLIILFNFPSPESEYAFLPLIAIAMFSFVPLFIVVAILAIIRKRKLKNAENQDDSKIFQETVALRWSVKKVVLQKDSQISLI